MVFSKTISNAGASKHLNKHLLGHLSCHLPCQLPCHHISYEYFKFRFIMYGKFTNIKMRNHNKLVRKL